MEMEGSYVFTAAVALLSVEFDLVLLVSLGGHPMRGLLGSRGCWVPQGSYSVLRSPGQPPHACVVRVVGCWFSRGSVWAFLGFFDVLDIVFLDVIGVVLVPGYLVQLA